MPDEVQESRGFLQTKRKKYLAQVLDQVFFKLLLVLPLKVEQWH
jgi:hypothetical protein